MNGRVPGLMIYSLKIKLRVNIFLGDEECGRDVATADMETVAEPHDENHLRI
jgi:hypothetical protein